MHENTGHTIAGLYACHARAGFNNFTRAIADMLQIDLPTNRRSGLIEAIQALKNVEDITFCHFTERDVIRHELVQSIVRAYRHHRGTAETETKR